MCGRYMVVTEGEIIEMQAIFEELGKRLDRSGEALPEKDTEVFPGSTTQVITENDGQIQLTPMFWGFKKWDNKGIVINARAETALEKPFFRESTLSRRCIIPSKGFYEWAHHGDGHRKEKSSDKYLIRREDSHLLFMAGICRRNEGVSEFSILTVPASPQMSHLHDRMPLQISNDDLTEWLSDPGAVGLLHGSEASEVFLSIAKV